MQGIRKTYSVIHVNINPILIHRNKFDEYAYDLKYLILQICMNLNHIGDGRFPVHKPAYPSVFKFVSCNVLGGPSGGGGVIIVHLRSPVTTVNHLS